MDDIKRISVNVPDGVGNNVSMGSGCYTKHILVDMTPKKERRDKCEDYDDYDNMEDEKEKKVPRKRMITSSSEWDFTEADLDNTKQLDYIRQIYNNNIDPCNDATCKIILKQLKYKLSGYRNQDLLKKIYSEADFITMSRVLQLLTECDNKCYYCNCYTKVLYEYVREPLQWSLERIDNSVGHNHNNVTIACLNCNLRRRTMNQERYVFTKQLSLVKKE